MNRPTWIVATAAVVGLFFAASFAAPVCAQTGDLACYFSPDGGCTEAAVAEINAAQQMILVQAYSFTSAPIAKALVDAHNRGVQIAVILDKSNRTDHYSAADFVQHAGIPTYIDAQHAIAHNKIMLIDGRTIITGSFNFTKQAEKNNAENMLVIKNRPDLYGKYYENFQHHLSHSPAYQGHDVADADAEKEPTKRHRTTSRR
ncbi:MAG TPA: phospholipase D family protein [Pirellulales bacterium]|nr:phospholipase D family protein [Pirellulales bacterium]